VTEFQFEGPAYANERPPYEASFIRGKSMWPFFQPIQRCRRISPLSRQKYGNTAPNTIKKIVPHDLFALFLRNFHYLYASIGSF